MVEIEIEYSGDLRTQAIHGPSGVRLQTDAPTDNQGKGLRFSPTDLLASALGSCALTIMGIYARKEGIALEGARVRVEKHMQDKPERRVGRLVLEFHLPPGIPAEHRGRLEKIPALCPVRRSLLPDIPVDTRFVWT
jgi:putative redox protein